MLVKVTQYMRPNGRQVEQELEIDDKCRDKYEKILDSGARLTAEQLMTGRVSQTIETDDGDFDIILTKGHDFEENRIALETMILRFDETNFDEWATRLAREMAGLE